MCFSCKGQKDLSKAEQAILNENLSLILEDDYSGLSLEENLIIRDAKTLQKFFSKINRTRKPGISVPKIDFSKSVIIVVCEGEHAKGKNVELNILKETEQNIELQLKPTNTETASKALVSPFKIYTLNTSRKDIIIR